MTDYNKNKLLKQEIMSKHKDFQKNLRTVVMVFLKKLAKSELNPRILKSSVPLSIKTEKKHVCYMKLDSPLNIYFIVFFSICHYSSNKNI